jgi:hypothetical protein
MGLKPPRTLLLPKAGNRPEECEDAFRVIYPQRIGPGMARVAISDGASESAFSREWARILADTFTTRPPGLSSGLTEDSLKRWLSPGQQEWHNEVPWNRLPWHGEAKARTGAYATLLGLIIEAAPNNSRRLSWRALAIGDTCLFMVHNDQLLLSFPLHDPAQFGTTPDLICSNPANDGGLWKGVHQHSGECTPGDLFILASDALACWFLNESAAGGKPWKSLLKLDSPGRYTWVEEQRRKRLMRNDDTALVIIKVT